MGNCHSKKTNVDRGDAEVDIGFRGGQFPSHLPFRAVNTYYFILNVNNILSANQNKLFNVKVN